MKKFLCCLAALLLLTTAALADVSMIDLEKSPYFSSATGYYVLPRGWRLSDF